VEKRGIRKTQINSTSNQKIKDIEIHSGMDSLLTWIKKEVLQDIKDTMSDPKSTIEDLHKVLAANNLEIKLRGNGVVIGDKTRNLYVKASDVHRSLSKGNLTKKFGSFKLSKVEAEVKKKFGKPKNKHWEEYQEISKQRMRNMQLRA